MRPGPAVAGLSRGGLRRRSASTWKDRLAAARDCEGFRLDLQPVDEVEAGRTTVMLMEFTRATFDFRLRSGAVERNHSGHNRFFGDPFIR